MVAWHRGSFVPAMEVKLTVCDRLFTRVGAPIIAARPVDFRVAMPETATSCACDGSQMLLLDGDRAAGTARLTVFDRVGGRRSTWTNAGRMSAHFARRTITALRTRRRPTSVSNLQDRAANGRRHLFCQANPALRTFVRFKGRASGLQHLSLKEPARFEEAGANEFDSEAARSWPNGIMGAQGGQLSLPAGIPTRRRRHPKTMSSLTRSRRSTTVELNERRSRASPGLGTRRARSRSVF